jgi:catechol 2,3-dioxygenase-like lactoylglutathione lyase family enzyme
VLTVGLNHVATLTNDAARLHAFYEEVFEAEVVRDAPEVDGDDSVRLSIIKIGPYAELNVFQIAGNSEADRQVPMFGRGRLDHFALQAASLAAFETIRERLMARGGATPSSPTSAPSSASSFAIPTVWRVKSAWTIPTPWPGSPTRPEPRPSATWPTPADVA